MKVVPRTLGVQTVHHVPVKINTQKVYDLIQNVPGYEATANIQSDNDTEYFDAVNICFAISQADNTAQIVFLGETQPDGFVATLTIYYTAEKPDYYDYGQSTLKQIQTVMAEYNRILQHIKTLENGPENDLPVQNE